MSYSTVLIFLNLVSLPLQDMPTALPPNTFPPNGIHAAYQRCLDLESAAPNLQAPPGWAPPIVCARLVGHLLRLAPDGNGRGQVQREIASAIDDVNLMKLAGHYMTNFVGVCKSQYSRYLRSTCLT
jgi:hypothetical protein